MHDLLFRNLEIYELNTDRDDHFPTIKWSLQAADHLIKGTTT
jgi:hypothetical protein